MQIENQVKISINGDKIREDQKWYGLKGYITNTKLNKEDAMEYYKELWQIEKEFKIAKTDLEIRPIYLRVQRRIETHICIAFVVYKFIKKSRGK